MSGAERVALVGATSQVGRELKNQLAEAGVDGTRIDLLDLEDHVGLVTDYGDEARVVVEAAEEPLRRAALACFCGNPDLARRIAPAIRESGGVAIDCTGALADDETSVVAGAGASGPRIAMTPHPAATLLGALGAGIDLGQALATVLLPASARDERGPDDMARESAQLLNLGLVEKDLPSRRVAFDLSLAKDARETIVAHLARMSVPAPRLEVVRAPVFHGIAASLYVPGIKPAAARRSLSEHATLPRSGGVDSPARVAGQSGVFVTGLRADGDGCWLWAVVDNYGATASAAVREILAALAPDSTH